MYPPGPTAREMFSEWNAVRKPDRRKKAGTLNRPAWLSAARKKKREAGPSGRAASCDRKGDVAWIATTPRMAAARSRSQPGRRSTTGRPQSPAGAGLADGCRGPQEHAGDDQDHAAELEEERHLALLPVLHQEDQADGRQQQ